MSDDVTTPDNKARNWGGKRAGQGRQHGSKNKATSAVAIFEKNRLSLAPIVGDAIANMTPLDIMLHAAALEAQKGDWRAAAAIARDACPYVHAKLSSVDITGTVETKSAEEMSDKELLAMIRDQAATRSVELNDKTAH